MWCNNLNSTMTSYCVVDWYCAQIVASVGRRNLTISIVDSRPSAIGKWHSWIVCKLQMNHFTNKLVHTNKYNDDIDLKQVTFVPSTRVIGFIRRHQLISRMKMAIVVRQWLCIMTTTTTMMPDVVITMFAFTIVFSVNVQLNGMNGRRCDVMWCERRVAPNVSYYQNNVPNNGCARDLHHTFEIGPISWPNSRLFD